MIKVFYFYRKNPLSFLGVAIGKFIEVNGKSSIDNYFNKETVSKEEGVCNQSNIPESRASCSTISDTVESDNSISCDKKLQSNPKSSALISNQLPSSSINSSSKKTDNSSNNVKSIKTMFAEMKSSSKSCDDSIVTAQNVDIKNENKKTSINSFFSNKLKSMSPIKIQVDDKVSTATDLSYRASPVSFFSKKLEIISPSKNILNNNVQPATRVRDSFFSRKLEIVSPSKPETNSVSPPLVVIQPSIMEETDGDVPSKLLCERCEKMIDIDLYDEHYDHHVAIELSKSWNSDSIVKPLVKSELHRSGPSKKKNNDTGQKRKHNANTSSSNSKKQCSSISSYFKPVLNP